ncbi:MAG TPA: cell wall-binding repeat-containing protein [Solirubrobacteraceae bacterium]|nr:cell wall-binding repeat-containing protein [Solirubrobacteraceae bacterium]
MSRPSLAVLLLAAALVAAGCGREVRSDDPSQPALLAPPSEQKENLGFPEAATKNTTRVPGRDAVQTAAAVARAVFPDPARRPGAVTLVDSSDWRVALAASALMAAPFKAPILFSDGTRLPGPSQSALDALAPSGAKAAGNAQVIRVGNVARPAGLKSTDLAGKTPLALTRAIAGLVRSARQGGAAKIIIASSDDPAFAMPAAGYAAKSGDPILFVTKDDIPPETRAALAAFAGLAKPRIYILGPSKLISPSVGRQLKRYGSVRRTGAQDPIRNAIEFARYHNGEFGWGIVTPGHGMVFTRSGRPLYAAAAAPLSGSGSYGPLFLLDRADRLPERLQSQLLDTQPAYRTNPVAGVYNHGWIIGDDDAISVAVQARIDALLEIAPEQLPGNLDAAEGSR